MKTDNLELWKKRLEESDQAYTEEHTRMDKRERLFAGLKDLENGKKAEHIRNIIFENIESQVSTVIPTPKVTAVRKEDGQLAMLLERFLRNELDRLPTEQNNDLAERTVPIQGGVAHWTEWDRKAGTHSTVGALDHRIVHPKQLAPQPGVFTSIRDMDWIIIKLPTTKEAIRRDYGVTVDDGEAAPEARSVDEEMSKDNVTLFIGYAKGRDGEIDRFIWANDTVVEDVRDYRARRLKTCVRCGAIRPLPGEDLGEGRSYDGGKRCPFCGGTSWEDQIQDFEKLTQDIPVAGGGLIPAGTQVPFYRPTLYPIVLQKNVSAFGKLLGSSDVDVIEDQQMITNRLSNKIIRRMMRAGTKVTLPADAAIDMTDEDLEVWRLDNAADKAMIGAYNFSGDLNYELNYRAQVYEEARQILGITDSFQGRKDATATSGKAKEFSAAQAAGRLESKRVMKQAAYGELFELMFKTWLAYADEPVPVRYRDFQGNTMYAEISRYDFLRQDAAGQWYWNDEFLFSTDSSGYLANNREAMWQETRQNLQSGAFGDPSKLDTLILFWGKMEILHYPGASETKRHLEDQKAQAAQPNQVSQTMPGMDLSMEQAVPGGQAM